MLDSSMTTFLFWNLNGKPLQAIVAALVKRHEVDVIMLAESSAGFSGALLSELARVREIPFEESATVGCRRIKIFASFCPDFIRARYDDDCLTIRHLNRPGFTDILLAVGHLPSKLRWRNSSQDAQSPVVARAIRNEEERLGHSRTVLVGDLNMNPFEPGLINANGMHAVMTRRIAAKGSRQILGHQYPFFYNPMWSLLGDASSGPPGTYYYRRAEQTCFFWNMFDQVLVRPDLLDRFDNADLAIIDSDGNSSLLDRNGIPDPKIASDHLPILFKLRL